MPFRPDRASDVVVIGTFSDGDVNLTRRQGTLASGKKRKERYSIDVQSEPLLMNLNELDIGHGVAETWASRIRDQILGIAVPASAATQAMRAKAAAAFQAGQSWALRRYAGGRIGPKAPNQTDKLFNDSGRLADGVAMRANLTDSTYTINFPANRFNREQFGRGYEAMVARFLELVPIVDAKKAKGDPAIEKAINTAMRETVQKLIANSEAELARAYARLQDARRKALKAVGGVFLRGLGL